MKPSEGMQSFWNWLKGQIFKWNRFCDSEVEVSVSVAIDVYNLLRLADV